jgi:hypothetical protein
MVKDIDRVIAMADEAGQTSLLGVVEDRACLEQLANANDRALWLFVHEPVLFRRAEEVRFTDEKRRGRSWDGFIGEPGLALRRDDRSLGAFKAALRTRFVSGNVHVDVFDRLRPMFDGNDCALVQIGIYHEGLPEDQLAFDQGDLVLRAHRPIIDAALTYEPATGVIEAVANDRESREDMVRFLARDLLGMEFENEKLPLRRYDLSVLVRPFDFPTDPEDGVASVEVKLLRLMPIDSVSERVTVECLRKAERTIWEMAKERFGKADPLAGGWVITQAKLVIRFHPKRDARLGCTLPLTISMPHGCNLRERTEEEQLIGEKYFRRWGILSDAG